MGEADCIAALRAENAALRAKNAELTQKLDRFTQMLEVVPGSVWESEAGPGQYEFKTVYVNKRTEQILGYSREEWHADPELWAKITHPDDRAKLAFRPGDEAQDVNIEHRLIAKDGRVVWVQPYIVWLRDASGAITGMGGIALDVTARKLADEERDRLQAEVIRAQQAALEELSTPLIPISADVMVMPLIGNVDQRRAERVLETLLQGINKARARYAIVDITGVPNVDTQTADALIRVARAAQLLGAKMVLTGIRPEVAQTLVTLGTDLEGILTAGNLESGIRHVSRRGET